MQAGLGSRLGAAEPQKDINMRGLLIFALASSAFAADNTGWIEYAGGNVTRDAAGKIVAIDLRSSWVTDSDMPRLAQLPDAGDVARAGPRI